MLDNNILGASAAPTNTQTYSERVGQAATKHGLTLTSKWDVMEDIQVDDFVALQAELEPNPNSTTGRGMQFKDTKIKLTSVPNIDIQKPLVITLFRGKPETDKAGEAYASLRNVN